MSNVTSEANEPSLLLRGVTRLFQGPERANFVLEEAADVGRDEVSWTGAVGVDVKGVWSRRCEAGVAGEFPIEKAL